MFLDPIRHFALNLQICYFACIVVLGGAIRRKMKWRMGGAWGGHFGAWGGHFLI